MKYMSLSIPLPSPCSLQDVQIRPGWLVSSCEVEPSLLKRSGKVGKSLITRIEVYVHHQTTVPQGTLKYR